MVEPIIIAAMVFSGLGLLLATFRVLWGPDAANRAVALDALTIISLPLIVWVAIMAQRAIYLDVALVYAVLSFIGVMALARFFDWGV